MAGEGASPGAYRIEGDTSDIPPTGPHLEAAPSHHFTPPLKRVSSPIVTAANKVIVIKRVAVCPVPWRPPNNL